MELCDVPLELLRRTVVEVIPQPEEGPKNVTGGDLAAHCGRLPNSDLWAACRTGTESGRPFASYAIFDDEQSARVWSPAEADQLIALTVVSHRRRPGLTATLIFSEKLQLDVDGHLLLPIAKFLQDITEIAQAHGLADELLGAPNILGRAA